MQYFCEIYGRQTLSGQFCRNGIYDNEMAVLKEICGEQPAVLVMDLQDCTWEEIPAEENAAVKGALEYDQRGGIVSLCWHWMLEYPYTTGWGNETLYADYALIDLEKILDGQDEEGYQYLMGDIQAAAQRLLILQEQDIPVLWRPLHEAGGEWFWWSKGGPQTYKKLWKLLYQTFTEEYGLHNLIWIYSGLDEEWYPGDAYVDIAADDIYDNAHCHGAQTDRFYATSLYAKEPKAILLSECGVLPDPDLMERYHTKWLGAFLWNGEYLAGEEGIFQEWYTSAEALKKFYLHKNVITLEEVPDYRNIEK